MDFFLRTLREFFISMGGDILSNNQIYDVTKTAPDIRTNFERRVGLKVLTSSFLPYLEMLMKGLKAPE